MQPNIHFHWKGTLSYPQGLLAQNISLTRVIANNVVEILALEHTPVITLGRRATRETDVRISVDEQQRLGVAVESTERGGQATLHMPGQLVIYPIVPLRSLGWGVRDYVDALLASTHEFLNLDCKIETDRSRSETGVYTPTGKVAFVGVRVSNGISSHGISLNVSNDLSAFTWIRSCGQDADTFDRLLNYGIQTSLESLARQWLQHFARTAAETLSKLT